MSTIIVTGSRDWNDSAIINRVLSLMNGDYGIELLVEGGARGADKLAREWAKTNGVPFETVRADWDSYGKSAGSRRNIAMLEKHPGANVVAFPLPTSIGTYHCIREAQKRKHKVLIVSQTGDWTVSTPRSAGCADGPK